MTENSNITNKHTHVEVPFGNQPWLVDASWNIFAWKILRWFSRCQNASISGSRSYILSSIFFRPMMRWPASKPPRWRWGDGSSYNVGPPSVMRTLVKKGRSMNYSYLGVMNHSEIGVINPLSYRLGAPHCMKLPVMIGLMTIQLYQLWRMGTIRVPGFDF